MWKNPWLLVFLAIIVAGVVAFAIPKEVRKNEFTKTGLMTDHAGLLPKKIERIERTDQRAKLAQIVQEAQATNKKIAIAGLQHSQGGHTYYDDAIVIDMRAMNRILEIDEQARTVKVEAGATWEDVQQVIAPLGLALQVTQSQSIFTIGGSLSVNGHGRDIRFGPMASTVKAMTILTPTGEQQLVRGDELLRYILGGYGLFGVIVDVTLELTTNDVYEVQTEAITRAQYEAYFNDVLANEEIAMHYARISVAPKTFLEEMYAINYLYTAKQETHEKLKGEEGVQLSKWALNLGRRGGAFEDAFWQTQKAYIQSINGDQISRNNVMRSESSFMEFTKPNQVEVLQEFFIPITAYDAYMTALKKWLPADDSDEQIKVHNITVRYAAADKMTALNYAPQPMLGLVVLLQHGTSEQEITQATEFIQHWTDLTLAHGGTYYLPYYPYQTQAQFQQAYPNWANVQKMKQKVDPTEIMTNTFYENYFK